MTLAINQPVGTDSEYTYAVEALTPRELEVASLVALAMNNREIAQALFLTQRAVESHITTIIRKLNLKNRTAICRWYLLSRIK